MYDTTGIVALAISPAFRSHTFFFFLKSYDSWISFSDTTGVPGPDGKLCLSSCQREVDFSDFIFQFG